MSQDEDSNEHSEDNDIAAFNALASKEAEVGILEKIRVENFMCHDHLELTFGPNVNFIVGVNGSGKSAVLVAITVGLGAKTSFTQRGTKITDLIKHNKNHATISIKLRNRGPDAFKPEVYGPSIIVERRISRDGGTSWKLKDAQGKLVSNKKSELNLILEQFNIQIDNPCNILMQDKSREFLANSKPKVKYQFFLEATQLHQMQKDFQFIHEQIEVMKVTLARKRRVLPEMEKQVQEYEREFNDMTQLQKLRDTIRDLKHQLAWATVQIKEDELKKIQSEIEKHKQECGKYETKRLQAQNDINKIEEVLTAKTKESQQLTEKIKEVKEEIDSLENEKNRHNKELRNKQNAIKDVEKRKSHAQQRLANVKKALDEEKAKIEQNTQAEKELREREIQTKKQKLVDLKEEYDRTNQMLQKENEELGKLEAEYHQVDSSIRDAMTKKLQKEQQLKKLKEQKQNRARAFGEKMPEIIALIDKNKSLFSMAPIGPIGMRLSLKDNKWATAVESAIASSLNSFIVNSHEDEQKLKELLKKNQLPPVSLIVTPFQNTVYAIQSSKIPSSSLTTMLGIVEADHPMVINALIDQHRIENKILVSDRTQAESLMFPRPPQNVTEAYTPDGSRYYVRGGNEVSETRRFTSRRLQVNLDEQIQQLQLDLTSVSKSIEGLKSQEKKLSERKATINHRISTCKKAVSDLSKKINALEQEINDLENFQTIQQPDVTELEGNMKRIKAEIAKLDEELEQRQKEFEKANEDTLPFQEKINEKQKETHTILQQVEKLEKEMTQIHTKLGTIKNHMAAFVAQIEKEKSIIRDLTEAAERKEKEIQDDTQKANRICPRVEVTKDHKQLQKDIEILTARVEKEQQGMRPLEEIRSLYLNAKKVYLQTKDIVQRLTEYQERIEKDLTNRVKMWIRFRNSIARRTRMLFNSFLSQKGYSGHIEFNFAEKTLDVRVQLDRMEETSSQPKQDARTLSGGERSFSTVSLLLALWEAMESPFRAMDEFDVYMDAVNRHLTIELLLYAARQHKHRQFIFITPHDLGPLQVSRDVKIIRMYPPERGFGTQSQVTIDHILTQNSTENAHHSQP